MKADALRVNLNAPKWLEMEFLQTKTRQGRWIDNNSYNTGWLTCWYLVVMCWCQIRWMVQMAKSEIQKGLGRIHVTAQRDTKSVLTHRNCLVYLSTHLRTYNKKARKKFWCQISLLISHYLRRACERNSLQRRNHKSISVYHLPF